MSKTNGEMGLRLAVALLAVGLIWAMPAARAQKSLSAKDLVRLAEEDQKNNRWEAARDKLKQAAAQKPKDKKIAEALKTTETYLADQSAARAIGLCDQLEIDNCEKEVSLAASYAGTPRVQEAQARLATRKKEVLDRWGRVQQWIAAGQFADAVAELENLTRFSYLFPTLAQEKERVRRLRVDSALNQGTKEMAAQRWDAATEVFTGALRLDPGNSQAVRGIEAAKKEKEAATAFQQAQNALQSKGYKVAYEANQKALRLFPDRQAHQELGKQIAAEWSKVLVEEGRHLSGNPDNLRDNQRAMEALEIVRRLDPKFPGLADDLRTVRLTLHGIYLQKAGEYEAVADNSRIALAYAYYMNAQQTNPKEFAFAAKMREVSGVFARKRTVQLLLNVENLSPAPPSVADVMLRRVRAAIGKVGLPDLKVRTLEEYQKNSAEDPQFVENRPDGKSPTALFTVGLTNYESETAGGDKPIEKSSKFVSGQEMVPNPAQLKLQEEHRRVAAILASNKGKPVKTKEGIVYTSAELGVLQQQLATTPREISRDKISEYTYQEFHLSVRALIHTNLEMRDMLEKLLLGSDVIEAADKKSDVEISGVREKDLNLLNRAARLPSAEQLLQQCQRLALEQLDEKVPRLVSQYLQRFYAEGEKALREGRAEDALENFLCHWFFFRGRLDEDQSRRIVELVKREIGLDLTTSTLPAPP